MIKDAPIWIASAVGLLTIIKMVGQAVIIAFNKLSSITDKHRATLIFLALLSIIAFVVFLTFRYLTPAGIGVPLSVLFYLAVTEAGFCMDRSEITRGDIWWRCVYPAMVFVFYFMEWYIRVSLRITA